MIQIRHNVFETNSSSTHALCLDTENNFPKYTQEHLDAFTDVVLPFSDNIFHEPHIFSDLKDKIRYFWTIWIKKASYGEDTELFQKFIGKLQSLVPQATFAYKFPHCSDDTTWYTIGQNAVYMEDSDYVFDEEDTDGILFWPTERIREFLLTGVIVFGNRDNYDYRLMESMTDLCIKNNNLKVIHSVTG